MRGVPHHHARRGLGAGLAVALACAASLAGTRMPVKEVLAQIETAAPDTEFTVTGVVAARMVLPDRRVLAYVHQPGQPGLAVVAAAADAGEILPRNTVELAGRKGAGPFGPALVVLPGKVAITATNQPFTYAPVPATLFQDASAMAGRYVELTNVTFARPKFDASGRADAKAAGGAVVTLRIGHGALDREAPSDPTDVFGVVVKAEGKWQLAAARFLPSNRKACQELAKLRTCLTCHTPEVKVVGPAYRYIAAKYRHDAGAVSNFIARMEAGSTGEWGTNVMAPLKTIVPSDDMKTLATWVFSYRWDALLAE